MQIRQEIFSSQKSKRAQILIMKKPKTTKIIIKVKFYKTTNNKNLNNGKIQKI